MTKRIANSQAKVSHNKHGASSLEQVEAEAMVVVAPVPHIFPSLHAVKNYINENQSLPDPQVQSSFQSRDPGQLREQETVNLNVVVHAPSVTGLSQRKDVGPSSSKVKIKCVKGVHFVNHCLSAPVVTNVQHVRNPPVGDRLQNFGRSGSPWVQIRGLCQY